MIAGHFEMEVAGARRMLSPGETLFVPAGTPHSGRLLGGVGQRLVAFTPGGIDRFFDEVGSSRPGIVTDRRRLLDAATEFGWEFLPDGARATETGTVR